MRFTLLIILALAGCAGSTPDTVSEPERGIVTKTFDMVRGSPDRIETAGRKNTNRLQLELKVQPDEVVLSKTRRLQVTGIIKNPTRRTLSLQFPTTQRLEILIQDEAGTVVARWSEDQLFAQALGHMAINPGEMIETKETISARDLVAGKNYRLVYSVPNYPDLTQEWKFTPR